MLTLWTVFLYLPLPAFALGVLMRSATNTASDDASALFSFIPFAVSCMLAAVGMLAIWTDVATNQNLSDEEKKRWKRNLVLTSFIAAVFYWRQERQR